MESNQLHEKSKEEYNLNRSFQDENSQKITKDSIKFRAIFPEEIWIQILGKITDPDDIENLLNSSLYFRDLLFEKRTLLLFPKVWNILGVMHHQNEMLWNEKERRSRERNPFFSPQTIKDEIRCESCGKFRERQWYSEILKYRLVCKTWCDTIDQFYGELPASILEPEMFDATCKIWLLNGFQLNYPHTMRKIVQHFRKTHAASEDGKCKRNPLVGRRLYMNFRNNIEIDDLLSEVTHLLQIYGEHIWHSEIIVNPGYTSWIPWYTFLRNVLHLLPNLKTVTLRYDHAGFPEKSILPPEERILLNREIALNPLPKLRSLKSLKTMDIISPVFKELIRLNDHITDLTPRHLSDFNPEYDLFSSSLPNLRRLEIQFFTEEAFSSFENMESKFPLEELDINLLHMDNLECSRVFRVLEREWSTTLKTLAMKMPRKWHKNRGKEKVSEQIEILPESASQRLNLPLVSHLTLYIPKMSCLDFVLPMKDSLEYLEFQTPHFTVDRHKETHLKIKWQQQQIQFVGWTEDLNASNIWSIFPKLKKITEGKPFFKEIWTRENWELECKIKSRKNESTAVTMTTSR